ncbi:hypothetical protein I4U23_010532 [Adineta vaga]|nr:hypothetical protein I4U23_010532 [Adineta vaga]
MQNDNTHIPTPEERYNYTRHVLDHCEYNSSLLCQAVGLHIDDDEMLEFNAGILPLPYIKTSLKYQAHIDVDSGQILLDERLQKPKSISTLAVTYFGRDFQGRKEVFDLFTDKLIDTMERYSLYGRHEEHIVEPNFEQISQYFRSMSEQMCEFVVCIMHGQSEEELTELRNNIKKCGTILYGIMTQCAVYSEIYMDERMTNYCDNLIRKINFKNGGINTEVVLYSAFKDRNIDKDKLMFFGGAVLHPMNVTCQNPSIAAIVGSGNSSCSTTATRVSKQYPKEGNRSIHMIVGMAEMIIELLDYYRHENQYLPNKVIFYRDGINNEEFLEVLDYEIAAIRRAFFKIYGDKRNHPHLTFIIVNHRHHTRFFTYKRNLYRTDDASGERPKETDNMSIGCVIDTTIVHPYQHNFYLNSHNTDRGVNNPSLYDVILNENDFTLNELELLTYYLCFTDSRSSSSEATPSVVHQANKATINAQDLFDNSTNSTGSNRNKRMQSLQNTIPIDLDYEILQVHENLRNRPVFA